MPFYVPKRQTGYVLDPLDKFRTLADGAPATARFAAQAYGKDTMFPYLDFDSGEGPYASSQETDARAVRAEQAAQREVSRVAGQGGDEYKDFEQDQKEDEWGSSLWSALNVPGNAFRGGLAEGGRAWMDFWRTGGSVQGLWELAKRPTMVVGHELASLIPDAALDLAGVDRDRFKSRDHSTQQFYNEMMPGSPGMAMMAGLITDILTDPTTYASAGIPAAGRIGRVLAKTLGETAGARAVSGIQQTQRALRNIDPVSLGLRGTGAAIKGGYGALEKHPLGAKAIDAVATRLDSSLLAKRTEAGRALLKHQEKAYAGRTQKLIRLGETIEEIFAHLNPEERYMLTWWGDQGADIMRERLQKASEVGLVGDIDTVMDAFKRMGEETEAMFKEAEGAAVVDPVMFRQWYVSGQDVVSKESRQALRKLQKELGIQAREMPSGRRGLDGNLDPTKAASASYGKTFQSMHDRIMSGIPTELDAPLWLAKRGVDHINAMATHDLIEMIKNDATMMSKWEDAPELINNAEKIKAREAELALEGRGLVRVRGSGGKVKALLELPSEVSNHLNRVIEGNKQGGAFEEFVKKVYDPYAQWWKSMAVLSPGYHGRNIAGNLFNAYLGGVDDPRWYMRARHIQSGMRTMGTAADKAAQMVIHPLRTLMHPIKSARGDYSISKYAPAFTSLSAGQEYKLRETLATAYGVYTPRAGDAKIINFDQNEVKFLRSKVLGKTSKVPGKRKIADAVRDNGELHNEYLVAVSEALTGMNPGALREGDQAIFAGIVNKLQNELHLYHPNINNQVQLLDRLITVQSRVSGTDPMTTYNQMIKDIGSTKFEGGLQQFRILPDDWNNKWEGVAKHLEKNPHLKTSPEYGTFPQISKETEGIGEVGEDLRTIIYRQLEKEGWSPKGKFNGTGLVRAFTAGFASAGPLRGPHTWLPMTSQQAQQVADLIRTRIDQIDPAELATHNETINRVFELQVHRLNTALDWMVKAPNSARNKADVSMLLSSPVRGSGKRLVDLLGGRGVDEEGAIHAIWSDTSLEDAILEIVGEPSLHRVVMDMNEPSAMKTFLNYMISTSIELEDNIHDMPKVDAFLNRAGLNSWSGEGKNVEYRPVNRNVLNQEQEAAGNVLGSARFLDDGRAILSIFKGANVSTLPHELAHVIRRWLPEEDLRKIAEWAGYTPGARGVSELQQSGFDIKSWLTKDRAHDNPTMDWTDNPRREGWLAHNKRTPTAGMKIIVDPKKIADFPGHEGEHLFIKDDDADVAELVESIRKEGWKEKSLPLIFVNADGSVTIGNGNHRIRAAVKAGLTEVPVEVRYMGGSENIEGVFNPRTQGLALHEGTGDVLHQLDDAGASDSWYYHQLERTILEKMPNRMPAADLLKMLEGVNEKGGWVSKIPGLKKEEIDWSGLREFLSDPDAAWVGDGGRSHTPRKVVDKNEVLEWLRMNQVEIKERVRGWDQMLPKFLTNDEWTEYGRLENMKQGAIELSEEEQISLEQLRAKVKASKEQLEPRFDREGYNLPGPNRQYRELILTLPPSIGKGYVHPYHFTDDPNIFAHIRFNDRIDPVDGKRMLFIEEIQSDLHQAGRERGYGGAESAVEEIRVADLPGVRVDKAYLPTVDIEHVIYDDGSKHGRMLGWTTNKQDGIYAVIQLGVYVRRDVVGPFNTAEEARESILNRTLYRHANHTEGVGDFDSFYTTRELAEAGALDASGNVPDAPFKDTWHEIAMKRTLRWAAENGYGKVGWTTAEQQVQRYDLRKHVEEFNYLRTGEDSYDLNVRLRHGKSPVEAYSQTIEQVKKLVGKKIAAKIEAGEGVVRGRSLPQYKRLADEDLEFGAEGMEGFYDQMLPMFVNKYVKKFDKEARVGRSEVQTGRAASDSQRAEFNQLIGVTHGGDATFEEYERFVRQDPGYRDATDEDIKRWWADWTTAPTEEIHAIDITPAMREGLMKAQPLHQAARGGAPSPGGWTTDDLRGPWSREAEEKFARGMERMLYEGNFEGMPAGLQPVLKKLRQGMMDVYDAVEGSPIDVGMTDEVRGVMEKVVGKGINRLDDVGSGIKWHRNWSEAEGQRYGLKAGDEMTYEHVRQEAIRQGIVGTSQWDEDLYEDIESVLTRTINSSLAKEGSKRSEAAAEKLIQQLDELRQMRGSGGVPKNLAPGEGEDYATKLQEIGRAVDAAMAEAGKAPTGFTKIMSKAGDTLGAIVGRKGYNIPGMTSSYVDINRAIGRSLEENAKLGMFMHQMNAGLSPEQAAAKVKKYLFDYNDLTEIEKKIMRRVIPFYSWLRFNIPLQLYAMASNPGRYKTALQIFDAPERFTQDFPSLEEPDYYREMALKRLPLELKGKPLYWSPNLPFIDLNKVSLADAVSSMNPMLKTAIELSSPEGYSYFTNQPIQKYPGEHADLVKGTPIEESLEGTPLDFLLSKKTSYAASQANPVATRAYRWWTAHNKGTLETQALSDLTGIKIVPHDAKQAMRGNTYMAREIARRWKRKTEDTKKYQRLRSREDDDDDED